MLTKTHGKLKLWHTFWNDITSTSIAQFLAATFCSMFLIDPILAFHTIMLLIFQIHPISNFWKTSLHWNLSVECTYFQKFRLHIFFWANIGTQWNPHLLRFFPLKTLKIVSLLAIVIQLVACDRKWHNSPLIVSLMHLSFYYKSMYNLITSLS